MTQFQAVVPRHQEEAGLHERVVHDMEHGADDSVGVGQSDAQTDIPDLGHAAVGQHAFHLFLRDGHDGTVDDGNHAQPCENFGERDGSADEVHTEYVEYDPDDGVDADLGTHGRDQRG